MPDGQAPDYDYDRQRRAVKAELDQIARKDEIVSDAAQRLTTAYIKILKQRVEPQPGEQAVNEQEWNDMASHFTDTGLKETILKLKEGFKRISPYTTDPDPSTMETLKGLGVFNQHLIFDIARMRMGNEENDRLLELGKETDTVCDEIKLGLKEVETANPKLPPIRFDESLPQAKIFKLILGQRTSPLRITPIQPSKNL